MTSGALERDGSGAGWGRFKVVSALKVIGAFIYISCGGADDGADDGGV